MNKTIAILFFVAITGHVIHDELLAHTHILGPPEVTERSVMPVERGELIGPRPMGESLSHDRDNPSWDWLNLTHTDPHHLHGVELHHSIPYRNFQSPDGAAVIFGWTFDRP